MLQRNESLDRIYVQLEDLSVRVQAVGRKAEGGGPDECRDVERTLDELRAKETLCRRKLHDLRRASDGASDERRVSLARAYTKLKQAIERAESRLM